MGWFLSHLAILQEFDLVLLAVVMHWMKLLLQNPPQRNCSKIDGLGGKQNRATHSQGRSACMFFFFWGGGGNDSHGMPENK